MSQVLVQTESMPVADESFWGRVRIALGALRQHQPAEPTPAYGQDALARSLGIKPRLGSQLEDELTEAWLSSGAKKVSLSLLVIELDRFVDYARIYGRDRAEACLKSVFATIGATLPRQQDQCFRLGRNQFVVVLPDYPVLMARVAAQKIAAAVNEEAIAHKDSHAGVVTVSTGVAVSNPTGPLDRRFFEAAIGALAKAQRRGLNRIESIDLRKAKTRRVA